MRRLLAQGSAQPGLMQISTLLQSRTALVSAAIVASTGVTCICDVAPWVERSVWVVAFLVATH